MWELLGWKGSKNKNKRVYVLTQHHLENMPIIAALLSTHFVVTQTQRPCREGNSHQKSLFQRYQESQKCQGTSVLVIRVISDRPGIQTQI